MLGLKGFILKKKLPITTPFLLGGESKRFGSPKAFLPWNGKSLAAHLAQTAGPLASESLVCWQSETQVPPDAKPFAKFVPDESGFPGPWRGSPPPSTHASKPWIFFNGGGICLI